MNTVVTSTGTVSPPTVSAEAKRALLAARLRKAAGSPALPLSFAQQRLWFLDQLEPNSALYNMPNVLRLTGRLNVDALQQSINALVARHESLRTRFVCVDENPAQVIDGPTVVPMRVIDLSAVDPAQRETQAQLAIRQEVNHPFRLCTDPLLRVVLVRLKPDEHLLVLTMHHIVSDGWSLGIFFRELAQLYSACLQGATAALPELPIRYTDYALWQREQEPVFESQLSYWKEQLGDHPAPLELPTDHPRRTCPTFRGQTRALAIPAQTVEGIKRLANQQRATLFMALLAAFKTLLHRYTQQQDIIVGSPIAGRDRKETEGLIGFFVNTLALRTRLEGNPTFEELLQRVRDMTLSAYAHQDVPFEKLVEALHPERSLGHLPFTHIMFAVQNNVVEGIRLPGLQLEFLDSQTETAKFELTVIVQETSEGLLARVEYNTDLFEPGTIDRLLGHYATLLDAVVANPRRRISELPMLTGDERRQLLVEWTQTETDFPRTKCIHELFEAQAELTPNSTAALFGHESLTYRELNSRANQLAHYLRRLGVRPDVPVAICVQRSLDMVVGFLAILKAGGAYVPLDPHYPKERLAFMLDDVQTPVLLAQQRVLEKVPKNIDRVICLDCDWELIGRENRQNLANKTSPENLAYIMYTSGSTGEPKGVAVPHRAVTRLVRNTDYIQFDATDRIAQVSNISFDAATFEIWGALLNGGQLIGISKDIALSPKDFARELRHKGITSMFLTTALFNQLASDAPGAFENLRNVLTGGEVADPKWMRAVLKQRPPQRLVHVYGPTENTTFSSSYEILEVAEQATHVPIGRPIANTQSFVLDPQLQPVPIGVPGELYLGGAGLARGYWNRPELTAERFVSVCFGPGESPRKLYKTGDLARLLPDGNIEFLGRMDNQVKVRGFRVELGEIETILSQHPAIRECVVKTWGNGGGHKRLVAYFVPRTTPAPNASALRAFLQEKLPDYMVPAAFVQMTALPLTPNGKVERNALPEPDKGRPKLEKKYAAPRDEVEVELTRIWEKILGIQPIGIEDKFFDLGGHSLLAVRVIKQIEARLGKKLRLATVFQAPTIERLAAIIREEIKESSVTVGTSLVEIQSKGNRRPLFLVHGAGGGMFWGYANLARHLGTEQPVYAFKSRGLDGREEFARIEEMAAQYVADLRVVQPRGPYNLGGYCFGGIVAYEMARQLEAQGEKVSLLALMNCALPNSRYVQMSWSPRGCLRFVANLFRWAGYFCHWTPVQRREFFHWKWGMLKKKLRGFRGAAQAELAKVDPGNLVDLTSFSPEQRRLWEAHILSLLAYHPQPYGGPVHLFRSPVHPLLCTFDRDYGWGDYAHGGVNISIAPAPHEKILEEPCVKELAGQLSEALKGAHASEALTPLAADRLAVFRGIVARATLFWLGAHGETLLLTEDPGLQAGGWTLGMVFHHLAGLSGARAPKAEPAAPQLDTRKADNPAGSALAVEEQPRALAPQSAQLEENRLGQSRRAEALQVPENTAERLIALTREERVTLPLTLLALCRALLDRYPHSGDFTIETRLMPSAGEDGELRCAVNELMVRTQMPGGTTFRELVRRMREVQSKLDGAGNRPGRDESRPADPCRVGRTALFEVFFNFKNAPSSGQTADARPAEFALGFAFVGRGQTLVAELDYNPGFFDSSAVARMLGHLQTLMSGIASNPDQPIAEIPLLTPEERRQLLSEWNETRTDFTLDSTYGRQFESRAAQFGSRIAARCQDAEITYAELNARANQLARHLQHLGVGPEVLVAVCLERSVDLMVALLAVLKAGGAYVPLDPGYPKERLIYMMVDSQAPVLVTQTTFLSAFAGIGAKSVCLDDPHQNKLIQRCSSENPDNAATSENLAYVIYTSGSTGLPKGVQITHRSLLNHNWGIIAAYQLQPDDRVLQFNPLSFDVSVEEMFPSWLAGAAVVLRTDEVISSPSRFLEFIGRERLTVLNLPTAYWHELVECLQTTALPPSVRLMVIGGEKASDEVFRRWKRLVRETVRLINSYGPTETTVTATLYHADPQDERLAIGRPLPNMHALVLDGQFDLVPVGSTGELYLGGAGVARGYLNRTELTAERFVPNPFPEVPCDRLYKTGDLARFRSDGNIEFLGRADQQVKIRGFRIELGEVEAALRAHPRIKEVVVIAREDVPGKKRLIGYFVPRHGSEIGLSELLNFVKKKLPSYMVPSVLVPLDALPLTPAGKLDRLALPKPANTRPALEQKFVAPRTPLEEAVANIWCEVLGLNRVGVHDNFFDLGGHSLLAIQVISRLRDHLQVETPLAKLFALPTVAELAAHLTEISPQSQPVLPASLMSGGRQLPLSATQRRIWFLDQFEPEQSAYNLPTGLRLTGPLQVNALEQSLTELARRHDGLRAMFPTEGGQPTQRICEFKEIVLPMLDLSHLSAKERSEHARTILMREAGRPYVMSNPMLRPLLLRLDEQEHWLLLMVHEIAADVGSVRVLVEELVSLYQSFATRAPATLPPVQVEYAEIAGGLRLAPEEESRQVDYWKRQLDGAAPLLELPADRPRPPHQSDSGARLPFAFDPKLSAALKNLGEEEGSNAFTTVLGLFQALLSRYTGASEIIVGALAPNRDRAEHKRVVGRLANFVALRCDLSGDPTFRELLGRVRTVVHGAFAHSTVPFARVIEEVRPERNASYTPIFQVLFSMDEKPVAETSAGNLVFAPFEIASETAKFDLTLHLCDTGEVLSGWVEYSTALFDRSRMERLVEHLRTLAGEVVRTPEQKVSALALLPPDEKSRLLLDWNGGGAVGEETTLVDWFEEQVSRTPDSVALVCGQTRLTYHELQTRAGQIADRLLALGVGHEGLVGICLERSWEMVAAILGTLRAGAAYIPMDPAYPKERLHFMAEDAKIKVLLTQKKLGLEVAGAERLLVESFDWTQNASAASAGRKPQPGDLAYVIYTSGSTGKPKGVAIEHRNAAAFVRWARGVFTEEELSGVLAATSICFDLSIFELFVPLSVGGKVILAENALALPGLPAAKEVKLINTVPSALRELLRVKGVPASVQVVNLAGEPLVTPLVDQIYHETAVQKVYDLYGPTETTTYSTFTLRKAGEPATIGKPLAGEEVYLFDHNRQLVPLGIPGEVYIGGGGVAREYLNQPELTAQKFVAHPFKPGARLYRTGDLARWREDGNLEYLGRIDHQVKIRGFRIELGEIESVLKRQAGVREVVVVAREDEPGNKRLVAYLAFETGKSHSIEELRLALKAHLPEYMVPSAFVFLEALPLTPNGKIDRKALPVPEQERSNARVEFVAPRTATEQQLAAIWREVLRIPEVGVRDNFFELGGHSLMAIQVVSRVREVLKVELPLFSLFDAPTIAALAKGLETGQWTQNQLPVLPLQPIDHKGQAPVSFVQERLWFIDQLEPNSHAYNVPMALRLKGPLDVAALQAAFEAMLQRHETLRTRFGYADGTLTQLIEPASSLAIQVDDLSTTEFEQREMRTRQVLEAEAQRPFDLARGPLLRARVVRIDADDHALIVVMHHSISDGWSLGIFFEELKALYTALAAHKPAPQLPALPVTYADFANWQRQWMQGAVLERELSYWKAKLDKAPAAIELPIDQPEIALAEGAASSTVELSPELTDSITRLSQREGSTPFSVLMAALAITLHKWTGQKDLVIGTVVAGRNRRELENVIGCFMNFLPIRMKIGETAAASELLNQVQTTVLESQSHQECPFEKIVEAINPERKLNRNPLYNVALLLQNFPTGLFDSETLKTTPIPVAMKAPLLDLRFEAELTGAGLSVRCEYKTELFNEQTIQSLMASYRQIVEQLLQSPVKPLREFQLTSELAAQARKAQERQQELTIAISGTFTVEPIEEPLRFWMKELGVPARLEFAPYNQVFQQLLDPASVLASNTRGLNVILLRIEDWRPDHHATARNGTPNGPAAIVRAASEFAAALKTAAARNPTPCLVCLCPPSPGLAVDAECTRSCQEAEQLIRAALESLSGVHLISSEELLELYPVDHYYDRSSDELGKVPYTPLFFSALGTVVARRFHAIQRPGYKVIALDCDNTLWSGVCGEDGAAGIGLDEPRQALHRFMRRQHETGMLLCLCSKNNEEDVREVFAQRSDLPLQLEHFAAWRLNWNPKSQNLRSLAAELNVGLDSFIFIDDNPVECAEVNANCPEVLTLQLPEEIDRIPQFLRHCWAFDHLKVTAEDRRRTEMYHQNRARDELRAESLSLVDFIGGLELRIQVEPMTADQLPRVAQLMQRTNQFNFTTRRRTESEIRTFAERGDVWTVSVSDRFGEYGLVGVMIAEARQDTLEVDSFLLSCRVLGRGVEYQMLARLGAHAIDRGLRWVNVHFERTAKNKPAIDFLQTIGVSFCQPLNGGYLFRFPAGVAAGTKFNPQRGEPNFEPKPEEVRSPSGTPERPSAFQRFASCRNIALDLNNPDAIHSAIQDRGASRTVHQNGYVAPRTDLERQLCDLWQNLLRIDRVGVQDDFFELGGHSLLAVRLFAELEQATGRKLPLVTLFQSPTIEQLANVLRQGQTTASQSLLVPLQPRGSKPPLFLVHGAGGDVLWGYANLAALMAADQPIYGFKSRGQVGLEEFTDLEEMARYYLQEVRAFQPQGPYLLGGYCFGGNVAYEMARQLRTQGEQVALLALLDTAPSNAGYETMSWWRPRFAYWFARNLYYWFEDFSRLTAEQRKRFVVRKVRALGRKLAAPFSRAGGHQPVDLEDVIDINQFPDQELKLWQIHLNALVQHVDRPYDGEVVLFRTRGQTLFCSLEPDFCWSRLVRGRVIIKEVPGSHENIFVEPNVQQLARELQACIDQRRTGGPAPSSRPTAPSDELMLAASGSSEMK